MPATTMSFLACHFGPLSAVDADLLVLPWFEGDAASAEAALDAATGGEIARALSSKEFQAKRYEMFLTTVTDRSWQARRVALIGGGRPTDAGTETIRKLASAAGLAAKQKRIGRVAFAIRSKGDVAELAQAATEGLTLAEFSGGSYKTADPPPDAVPEWIIAAAGSATESAVADAVAKGRVLGQCSNLARALANEPGNTLTPSEFARRAAALASDVGVRVDILDEKKIADLGMGLLLGVARGSNEPPRLMVFHYDPPGAPQTPVLGLVGKGITFDTGGISIKPADNMERMKDDMAGGAAVVCAMRAIALLKGPMRVIGVVPATENMPGGKAIKPGDILKSAEGKTVEVINTDAEGRLILGDGLWYARQLGATHLVDVATLTGAVVVALGKLTSAVFGTPQTWVDQVRRAAERGGDRVWPMPLVEEYKDQLKSEIAGTAWADEASPFMPKGATGVAVRTLAQLALSMNDVSG